MAATPRATATTWLCSVAAASTRISRRGIHTGGSGATLAARALTKIPVRASRRTTAWAPAARFGASTANQALIAQSSKATRTTQPRPMRRTMARRYALRGTTASRPGRSWWRFRQTRRCCSCAVPRLGCLQLQGLWAHHGWRNTRSILDDGVLINSPFGKTVGVRLVNLSTLGTQMNGLGSLPTHLVLRLVFLDDDELPDR